MSDIEGLDNLMAYLNGLDTKVRNEVYKSVNKAVKRVQAEAKLLAPPGDGRLRNSIVSNVKMDSEGIEGTVETNLEYAPFVEFGTGEPGSQGLTTGYKRLPEADSYSYTLGGWVYYDEKNGRFVYTKGRPATPFMYPAINNNREKIKADIAEAVRGAIKND